MTFFDTANEYGHGLAEQALGRAIQQFPRDAIVVGTKCSGRWAPCRRSGDCRKHIFEQCNKSTRTSSLTTWTCSSATAMTTTPLKER